MTSEDFTLWHSDTHTSILHLDTWYMIYHIKRYIVEVIKQEPEPMYHTHILNNEVFFCFFCFFKLLIWVFFN